MPWTVPTTVAIQAELNGAGGGFTDLSADVRLTPNVTVAYGIQGATPNDRVASTGRMVFALNNATTNSGAKLGYYSPDHANVRSGFAIGIAVRLAITYSGTTYYKFRGTLEEIIPRPGQYRERDVLCTVVDWMDEAARTKIRGVAAQTNQRSDQIFTTVLANITRQPPAQSVQTGRDTYAYCVPGDAVIATPDGPCRAADLRVGMRMWGFDERRGTYSAERLLHAAPTTPAPVLHIKTCSRTLSVTATHRVLVRRRHHAPRGGPGGYKAVEWRSEWIRAGDLRIGDYVVVPRRLASLDVGRTAPNGRHLTAGFMAFCGLYIGDGCMQRRQDVPCGVSIAHADGAPYMPYYREVMRREFTARAIGCGGRLAKDRKVVPLFVRQYAYAPRATAFSSRTACDEMVGLGFDGLASTKRIPSWVFSVAEDLQLAFLSGYLDADGTVDARGVFSFTSVNPDLIADVQQLCWAVGISTGRIRKVAYAGRAVVNGRLCTVRDAYAVTCTYGENNRLSPMHPRKLSHLASARHSQGPKSPSMTSERGRKVVDPRWHDTSALQRVIAIDETSEEPVFNFLVSGPRTFISDGVVVHNSLDTTRGEGIAVLEEFQRLALSEAGYIYQKGDTTQGGTLVFESRTTRATNASALSTLAETMTGLTLKRTRGNIINRVQVMAHPRSVDAAATTVIYTMPVGVNQISLTPSESRTVQAPYTNPTLRDARIGATAQVTPVSTTDYTFNTASDGTGTDITSSLGVTATFGGDSAVLVLTNNDATRTGYVTKLQLRGKGIYDTGEIMAERQNTASQTSYGLRTMTYQMPYQGNPDTADSAASYFLNQYLNPTTFTDSITFDGNYSATQLTAALAREPGDAIAFSETVTGLTTSTVYFIQNVRLVVGPAKRLTVTWGLTPASTLLSWLIGTAGSSEIGVSSVLGF